MNGPGTDYRSDLLDAVPGDVRAVSARLINAGHDSYLVGGSVRDLLIGRTPGDFDVATRARPEQVMELFGRKFALPTGLQHGTVTVLTDRTPEKRQVEVTTFRGEGVYLDGRRPSSVSFSDSIDVDLERRDFTINAIALGHDGRIVDPFGGSKT